MNTAHPNHNGHEILLGEIQVSRDQHTQDKK
jgi:hypothetical protein